LEEYPDRKGATRIIHNSKNEGISCSRNIALDNATGEFIFFVDSDDWLEPGAVEALVRKQESTDADIVSGSAYMHTDEGVEILKEPDYRSKEEMVLMQLQYTWDHVLWRRIIRRALFTENGIRCINGYNMAEDKFIMAQLSYYAQSFSKIDDIVYHYEKKNDCSFISLQSKDWLFERTRQYIGNWLGIYHFFCDKEEVFHGEAARKTIHFAKNYLKESLKDGRRKDFRNATETIDKIETKYWPTIGWSTKGLKGELLHNYLFMRGAFFAKMALRHISKLFQAKSA
jgi:glycosyltransferase involved in cell wall biosynthesis